MKHAEIGRVQGRKTKWTCDDVVTLGQPHAELESQNLEREACMSIDKSDYYISQSRN